jgi:hypothetical protein
MLEDQNTSASPGVATEPTEPTIALVAREALDIAGGNALKATELMVERVESDGRLYRLLMDPLVRLACYNVVSQQIRSKRKAVYKTKQPSKKKAKASVAALAAGNLLDFPLPGGLRLGEATRNDVAAAQAFYASQASDMGHKARWLGMVLHALPKGKKVKDAITPAKLEAFKVEAEHAAAA